MKVAIVGAGVTGLAAAAKLIDNNHEVTILERGSFAGGLAAGFRDTSWEWSLEHHYHHIFTTDTSIINLAGKVGHPVFFCNPKTCVWHDDKIVPFDGPIEVLSYPYLSVISKLRLSAGVAFLKVWKKWKLLEGITAKEWILNVMGSEAWDVVWKPLFKGKFGKEADNISAVWFWARIHARSKRLGYFENGFQGLIDSIVTYLSARKVKITFDTTVKKIVQDIDNKVSIETENGYEVFDRVIVAAPGRALLSMVPDLADEYKEKIIGIRGIGAVTLVLALKKQLLRDSTYWLNVNQEAPFLAIVEHTNMIDKKHYGNDHLVYIGNYLENNHDYFSMTPEELLAIYLPSLQKINPDFDTNWLRKSWKFSAGFAQPLVPLHYSEKLPDMETGIPHIYWAGMELVYPWDRGTNFAVEWGEKVANLAMKR